MWPGRGRNRSLNAGKSPLSTGTAPHVSRLITRDPGQWRMRLPVWPSVVIRRSAGAPGARRSAVLQHASYGTMLPPIPFAGEMPPARNGDGDHWSAQARGAGAAAARCFLPQERLDQLRDAGSYFFGSLRRGSVQVASAGAARREGSPGSPVRTTAGSHETVSGDERGHSEG